MLVVALMPFAFKTLGSILLSCWPDMTALCGEHCPFMHLPKSRVLHRQL